MMNRLLHLAALLAAALFAGQAFALLPIESWRTASGARVLFVESRSIPMLDVQIDFPAGSARAPDGKSGVASLTRQMLMLGAGELSEKDIADQLADVGAQLDGRTDDDRGGLSLRTLSSSRERTQALEILTQILSRPAFPAASLAREKARVVAQIKEQETKPEGIAGREFRRLLYPNHPYGRSATVDSVNQLGRDDLVQFYKTHYLGGEAVVSILGDVSRQEAEQIAEQITRALPQGEPVIPLASPQPSQAASSAIAHPATQSHIMIGLPALRRGDPDYFPLLVGNWVLGGGGFVSRLVKEVREKRGLVYSVHSYFNPMAVEGPYEIGLQTKKEQADEALKVVRDTVAKFLAEGPTEQEIAAAKENLINGFPLRVDSNRKLLDHLAVIGFYRLPTTYLDEFTGKIAAVTLDQVRDAFNRRVDFSRAATVQVGVAGK